MKKILITVFALILSFGLYSCDKENMGGVDLGDIETPSDYFVLVEEDNTVPDLFDATMETDLCMIPAEYPNSMMMHKYKGKKNDKKPPRGKRFFQFGQIFRSMDLTETQIALIPDIIKDHYLCMYEAKMAFRTALDEVFAQAREDRLEIITDYRNGDITRQEAYDLIKALNETTRAAIQNSEAHATFEAAMCECFNEMITSIEEILDDDQLAEWQTWLDSCNHPCLEEETEEDID